MNKKILREMGFGKEVDAVENQQCPFCKSQIVFDDFKDEVSRKEYEISGLCQKCQDKVFK